jgi:hypothetical protein
VTLGPLAVAATFTTYLTAAAAGSLRALTARVATARHTTDSTTERGGTQPMSDTQPQTRRRSRLPIRLLAVALVALLGAALLAGCASSHPHRTTTVTAVSDDGTLTMVKYGENNRCYYVDSPAEALALISAGLCPAGWTPYPMPSAWEATYWYYYDSPTYITRYVPATRQTTYNTTIINFQKSNSSTIASSSKNATYKSSTGKTVTAPPTASLKFGGGDSFGASGAKNGPGNLRASTAPAPAQTTAAKSGTTTQAPAPAKTAGNPAGGNLRAPAPAPQPKSK